MAVAAHASLVSLTHVLDNIHYRAEHQCLPLDIDLIETLQEKVNFLLDFVEAHSLRTWEGTEAPWRKMAEIAFEAEDFIDFHVVNQLCRQGSQEGTHAAGYTTFNQDIQNVIEKNEFIEEEIWAGISRRKMAKIAIEDKDFIDFHVVNEPRHPGSQGGTRAAGYSTFNQDIQNVIEKIECIKKDIWADIRDEDEGEDAGARIQPTVSVPPRGSLATASGGKSIMVGFDKHVIKILDGLTNTASNLQIFPIVGPGGIEKDPLYIHEFVHFSPSTLEAPIFLCNACKKECSPHARLKLLSVMKFCYHDFSDDYGDLFQISGLRSVWLGNFRSIKFTAPPLLHLLWNLQTLEVDTYIKIPSQIWKMPQVRHLDIKKLILPDFDITVEGSGFIILKTLHTLSHIHKLKCSKDLSRRIPNIKKLNISTPASPCDLTQFRKLESLKISSWIGFDIIANLNLAIPESLKELRLESCIVLPEDMKMFGSLPNLEVLELHTNKMEPEWNLVDGEFCRLKVLYISRCELRYLRAKPDCFCMLESLSLAEMDVFQIPLDIGCKYTLGLIELHRCGKSVIESARKIWEEHLSRGNENLQVHVKGTQVDPSLEEPDIKDTILDEAMEEEHIVKISL